MVNLSKQGREDLRRNRIQTGNEKRWKLQEDYLERKSLSVREWTVKGVLTRLYGQGVQKLFASFPKNAGVAVAGSVAVAIYDVKEQKKDIDWLPAVVKVFCAVPFEQRERPLSLAFPVMIKWLDEVREKGFDYRLDGGGKSFCHRSVSFLFKCRNAKQHALIRMPGVLFLVRCADSVRQMCERLDLTVSSPVLTAAPDGAGMEVQTTERIREAFESRMCHCRYHEWDEEAEVRVKKYRQRGFKIVQGFHRAWYCVRSEEPFPCGLTYKGADVPLLLGRKLTAREEEEFFVEGWSA